jgi:hypothetical protein
MSAVEYAIDTYTFMRDINAQCRDVVPNILRFLPNLLRYYAMIWYEPKNPVRLYVFESYVQCNLRQRFHLDADLTYDTLRADTRLYCASIITMLRDAYVSSAPHPQIICRGLNRSGIMTTIMRILVLGGAEDTVVDNLYDFHKLIRNVARGDIINVDETLAQTHEWLHQKYPRIISIWPTMEFLKN